MSTVQLIVEGLPSGKSVFTALGWCQADDGSDLGRAQWQEHPSNGGNLFVVDTRVSHIGEHRAVKLMVKANAGASINAHGQWRVAYWK
jgi:hypothetical protein